METNMKKETLHVTFTEPGGGCLRAALGDKPEESVISLVDDLSFGPISPYDLEDRRAYFDSLFADVESQSYYRMDMPKIKDFWDRSSSTSAKRIVWFTRRSSMEYTGFLELLSREDDPFDLLVVDLTEGVDIIDEKEDRGPYRIVPASLGEMRGEWLIPQAKNARALTEKEAGYYLEVWDRLRSENSMNRTIWRGQLYSANESMFDEHILNVVPSNWISVARLMGEVLAKVTDEYHLTSDSILYSRLLNLAEKGLIETEGNPYSMRHLKVRRIP
jgi:hypothetical protein